MSLEFPKGFLWGSATSAHQVEGNNHNDWTEWERACAARLAIEAKARHGSDPRWAFPEAFEPENYVSGQACDHYNRFREDFDIARSLGQNAHRFSIEWSRVEPKEGLFDEAALTHYREVLLALRKRGMEPFVTLWHWTNPTWIRDIGGWENKKTIGYFLRYLEKVLDAFAHERVTFWMPLNEPGTYVGLGYIQGSFPPALKSIRKANRVFKNLMTAYRKSYALIHEKRADAMVGMSHYAIYMRSHKNLPWNTLLVKLLDYIRNWRFLNSINRTNDFIGIQYYHVDTINVKFAKARWGPIDTVVSEPWITDTGWEVYPEGLYHILKRARRYQKPIFITENGLADARDAHREKFIKKNLMQVLRSVREGVDVRGYFYWSLLDNFEWEKGFWPRFGLVAVDYKTMERKVRPSARAYAAICRSNAIPGD